MVCIQCTCIGQPEQCVVQCWNGNVKTANTLWLFVLSHTSRVQILFFFKMCSRWCSFSTKMIWQMFKYPVYFKSLKTTGALSSKSTLLAASIIWSHAPLSEICQKEVSHALLLVTALLPLSTFLDQDIIPFCSHDVSKENSKSVLNSVSWTRVWSQKTRFVCNSLTNVHSSNHWISTVSRGRFYSYQYVPYYFSGVYIHG